jgi:N-acetylglutamate synthase-like GNAT family acetyltransferase
MSETIRALTVDDVPAALQLSTLAGWNQTTNDWRLLLDLSPDGCFAMEHEGRVVATATLSCYGNRLGWIGMVLTHPEYRHRGYAKHLFSRVLDQAKTCGIKTLKLDATDQGQPLYESYGFKAEQSVERWSRAASERKASDACAELVDWRDLDTMAFGADRSDLLETLRRRGKCFTNPDAYLLTRPGRIAAYLGPFVARSRDAARDVLQNAISDSGMSGIVWDLLPSNQDAVELASELGFSTQRRLARMFRGEQLRGRDELIYAIAGFELG